MCMSASEHVAQKLKTRFARGLPLSVARGHLSRLSPMHTKYAAHDGGPGPLPRLPAAPGSVSVRPLDSAPKGQKTAAPVKLDDLR